MFLCAANNDLLS